MEQYLITMTADVCGIPSFVDFTISLDGKLTPEDLDDIKKDVASKNKIKEDSITILCIYKF